MQFCLRLSTLEKSRKNLQKLDTLHMVVFCRRHSTASQMSYVLPLHFRQAMNLTAVLFVFRNCLEIRRRVAKWNLRRTSKVATRAPRVPSAASFLLFEKNEWSAKNEHEWSVKNDHRWVISEHEWSAKNDHRRVPSAASLATRIQRRCLQRGRARQPRLYTREQLHRRTLWTLATEIVGSLHERTRRLA